MLTLFVLSATAKDTLPGVWKGDIYYKGLPIDIILYVSKNAESYSATFDCPQHSLRNCKVEDLKFDGKLLSLKFTYLNARLEGKFIEEKNIISAEYLEAEDYYPIDFSYITTPPINPDKDLLGVWSGYLKNKNENIEFKIKIYLHEERYFIDLNIPRLTPSAIPAFDIKFENSQLSFTVPFGKMSYKCVLNKEKTELIGQAKWPYSEFEFSVKK